MVTIMPVKMTTPVLLKIRVFWKNSDDVIISVHDATNDFLSRDSNILLMWSCDQSLVTAAFLWVKLS